MIDIDDRLHDKPADCKCINHPRALSSNIRLAAKLKIVKGKGSQKLLSSPQHPVELDTDSDDGSCKQVGAIPANGNEEDEHLEHQALSEARSYDGEFTDPALLDEEETANIDGKKLGSNSTGWPGSGGGYNAMKSHNGQYYSGMAIGGSHTWNYQPGVWKETKKEPFCGKSTMLLIKSETTKLRLDLALPLERNIIGISSLISM